MVGGCRLAGAVLEQRRMRIGIFGLGAVGGYLGARLVAAGHTVSVVARGATLEAIRRDGLVLQSAGARIEAKVAASADAGDLGVQDVVFSTVKATDPVGLARGVAPLLGPDTAIVLAQNGIPWWYADGLSSVRPAPPDLRHLDPSGTLRALGVQRFLGGIILYGSEMAEPGVAIDTNSKTNGLLLGEPDDRATPRVRELRALLVAAGMSSPVVPDIRQAIWRKLMINMSASMIATMTGHKLRMVARDPRLAALYLSMANEAAAIARAHGIDMTGFDAAAWLPNASDHTPSISVDLQRGRAMELDPIVLTPLDFGRAAGVATPSLDAIAALAVRRALDKGLIKERLA